LRREAWITGTERKYLPGASKVKTIAFVSRVAIGAIIAREEVPPQSHGGWRWETWDRTTNPLVVALAMIVFSSEGSRIDADVECPSPWLVKKTAIDRYCD